MLNLVPLQFLALFGYALLRVVVGFIWLELALRHKQDAPRLESTLHLPLFPWPKVGVGMIIITEFVIGGLFVIGFLTQVAALLSVLWCLKLLLFRRYFTDVSFPDVRTTLLLLTIGITLCITGAGAFAFDLPI
jgi:uncharacterized membrane protein YphA (DoxX/SURF4 family)